MNHDCIDDCSFTIYPDGGIIMCANVGYSELEINTLYDREFTFLTDSEVEGLLKVLNQIKINRGVELKRVGANDE